MSIDNLFLDSYNLIHRSRFDWGGGLATGENQIIYNFMKSIKPILEKFDPKKVYFVLDGAPKARLEADSEYKANRKQESLTPEEEAYWASFHNQKRTIINLAKELLPFTTVYHPDFECDDISIIGKPWFFLQFSIVALSTPKMLSSSCLLILLSMFNMDCIFYILFVFSPLFFNRV